MKRTTIKGLQFYADDHNKHNSSDDWDWFDVIMYWTECGNMNNVRTDIESMSKIDTLKVIERCVDNVNCSQYEDSYLMRVYNYALASLKEKLTKRRKSNVKR